MEMNKWFVLALKNEWIIGRWRDQDCLQVYGVQETLTGKFVRSFANQKQAMEWCDWLNS